MIIGNGLIAKAFKSFEVNEKVIIFASGVSNSQNKDLNVFEREVNLVNEILDKYSLGKLFVYFSTCSIDDNSIKDSLYIKHKLEIEKIIANKSKKYLIIRISNPIGFTNNPNTIINYLFEKIKHQKEFIIWKHAKRNLIDVEDLYKITKYIIDNNLFTNKITNIANTIYFPIINIVNNIEKLLGIKSIYSIKNSGGTPIINTDKIKFIINDLGINFNINYLGKVINKYYN